MEAFTLEMQILRNHLIVVAFEKHVCDLDNNSYLISHSQKLPLEDDV